MTLYLLSIAGFAVLEYAAPDGFPAAGTLALTLVALLLPLSSLWASMVTTDPSSSFNVSQLCGTKSSQNSSTLGKTFNSASSGQMSFGTEVCPSNPSPPLHR